MSNVKLPPSKSSAKVTMTAIAYPSIRWFNFVPRKLERLRGKQLQKLVNDLEAAGNKVLEVRHHPFIHSVLVAYTETYQEVK